MLPWRRPAGEAQIPPLAWKLSNATGVALKSKKKKRNSELLINCSLSHPSPFKEKERELCVRERLAENKLARAESLLKNYSLLKDQKFLSLAGGPGMRTSSVNRSWSHK